MQPSYGAFINSQEMLKEVLQVVKKDKNLCMIGGMYKTKHKKEDHKLKVGVNFFNFAQWVHENEKLFDHVQTSNKLALDFQVGSSSSTSNLQSLADTIKQSPLKNQYNISDVLSEKAHLHLVFTIN